MNRREFMGALKRLLVSIPEEESTEVLQYYEDYFEDAGAEHEEEVIKELGSPEKVAAMIWADFSGNSSESGEFTESGYTDVRFEEKESPACCHEVAGDETQKEDGTESTYSHHREGQQDAYSYHREGQQNTYSYQQSEQGTRKESAGQTYTAAPQQMRTSKPLKILLIVLIVLTVLWWLIPAVAGVAVALISVIAAVLGCFLLFAVAAAAVAFGGVVILIAGITGLAGTFASAIWVMGIALLMIGLGTAACVGAVKLCLVVYPAIFRFAVELVRRLFHRKAVA